MRVQEHQMLHCIGKLQSITPSQNVNSPGDLCPIESVTQHAAKFCESKLGCPKNHQLVCPILPRVPFPADKTANLWEQCTGYQTVPPEQAVVAATGHLAQVRQLALQVRLGKGCLAAKVDPCRRVSLHSPMHHRQLMA